MAKGVPVAGDGHGPAPSVAAELEAIFAAIPRPTLPPDQPRSPQRSRRRRRAVWWPLLVALLGLAVLFAAAALLFSRPHRLAPMAPRIVAPPRVMSQAVAPPPAPAVVEPPLERSPPVVEPPRTVEQTMAERFPLRHAKPVARPARPRRAPAAAPVRRAKPDRARPLQRSQGCGAAASRAWCLRKEEAAADDRLRDAYAAAVRSGVDRAKLKDIGKDWARLRHRAIDDPDAMIRGYAGLTGELRRLAAGAAGR